MSSWFHSGDLSNTLLAETAHTLGMEEIVIEKDWWVTVILRALTLSSCKDADKTFVEYVLQDYNRPMGVATYKTSQEERKNLLPDEEEMKNCFNFFSIKTSPQ